jgi:hypothetical protein
MDLKWPKMTVIRPGASYSAGERLYWPDYRFSLRVPPACTCDAGEIYAFLRSSEKGLEALVNVHKPSAWLVRGWLDEPFTADRDRLEPVATAESRLGVNSRRFASASTAGYKMTVDDPFRYRASAMLTGPVDRARDLSLLLRQVVGSIRFVNQDPLDEQQQQQAILPWLNSDASDEDEVLLYIDRHFYLLRNDLMDVVGRLARQAEIDRHPMAERIGPLWAVLQRARQIADRGAWDQSIAALAPRREWRL